MTSRKDSTGAQGIREMSIALAFPESQVCGAAKSTRPRLEVSYCRNAVGRWRRGNRLEIGMDVGKLLVRQYGGRIRGHVAIGAADVAFERLERQGLGEPWADAALALIIVAFEATDPAENLLAPGGGRRGARLVRAAQQDQTRANDLEPA